MIGVWSGRNQRTGRRLTTLKVSIGGDSCLSRKILVECKNMKHSKLHGVAHNFADSLAGGLSFVVPNYILHTTVSAEAAVTEGGVLAIDFLDGTTIGAYSGGEVENAAPLFRYAFPAFCVKHSVDHSDYRACLVHFFAGVGGNSYIITVEDRDGKRTSREYLGRQGKRSKSMDDRGRVRPKQISPPDL